MAGLTHYDLLGIDRNADAATVRAAYRAKMRVHHPDRSRFAQASAMAQALNEAYAVLGDPAKRANYDRSLGGKIPGELVKWDMPETSGRPIRVAERVYAQPLNPIWLLILWIFLISPFVWGIWYYAYR